jgi:putative effector of murein hydrolase LrgA (UPF0299 family)
MSPNLKKLIAAIVSAIVVYLVLTFVPTLLALLLSSTIVKIVLALAVGALVYFFVATWEIDALLKKAQSVGAEVQKRV